MRKAICPKCQIPSFYVKNSSGEIMPVYVSTLGEVVPKGEGVAVEVLGCYDLSTIYCFGCSWSGSAASLAKRR